MLSSSSAEALNLEETPQIFSDPVLKNISWQTYQALLTDMGEHRVARLTFDQGLLQIKMPSQLHEIINRLLARIVTILTEEFNLEVINLGSTTLDRPDLAKSVEPDTCFYIQNASQLTGVNPERPAHLPPDLVIEVDITSPSIHRMAVYAALGVPEIWCYGQRQGLRIYHLQPEANPPEYQAMVTSIAFPQLTSTVLNEFLILRQTETENTVIRQVRDWVRASF